MDDGLSGLRRLLEVTARLLAPDGCPWDRQQTPASMAPHLLEEAFEAADALALGDADGMREELGDVLVNVCLVAAMLAARGGPSFDAIAAAAAEKLVRRHPHVFAGLQADAADRALQHWEREKRAERSAADARAGRPPRGALSGVPEALPALLRAFRVGEKAAKAGFDWPDRSGPRAKVDEELGELDRAVAEGDPADVAAELGDLLFSVANFARHLGANPEMALRGTVAKFQRRFAAVERDLGDLTGRSLAELDAAWERAKAAEG